MGNSIAQLNCIDLVKDCVCEYVLGSFYGQLTPHVITAFLINDKAIIHTHTGQTIIESGFEASENIVKRLKEVSGNDLHEDTALSIHIGDWEITALADTNIVHISKK